MTHQAQGGSGKAHKEDEKRLTVTESHSDEAYYKQVEVKKALTIVERMANQNTYDEVTQDFKYWEDLSDKMAGRKGESSRKIE